MTSTHHDGQATATGDLDRAVLAFSRPTVWHRDLPAQFYELAGLLHQVVCFNYLTPFLHDAARSAPGRRRRSQGGASRVAPPVCFPARLVSLSPQLDAVPCLARRRIGGYCAGTAPALGWR